VGLEVLGVIIKFLLGKERAVGNSNVLIEDFRSVKLHTESVTYPCS
jgi:hypothetical protein